MKRSLTHLAFALFLLSAAACSSTQPPAAPALQGNKVISTLKDLASFYQKKNLPGFMGRIDESFKDRREFEGTVRSVFSKYDTVQFSVQYSKMFITIEDKGMTRATFNWNSGWETSGGSMLKNSGRAIFVFEPKDARLVSIEGKNPFLPQAIETPKQ